MPEWRTNQQSPFSENSPRGSPRSSSSLTASGTLLTLDTHSSARHSRKSGHRLGPDGEGAKGVICLVGTTRIAKRRGGRNGRPVSTQAAGVLAKNDKIDCQDPRRLRSRRRPRLRARRSRHHRRPSIREELGFGRALLLQHVPGLSLYPVLLLICYDLVPVKP